MTRINSNIHVKKFSFTFCMILHFIVLIFKHFSLNHQPCICKNFLKSSLKNETLNLKNSCMSAFMLFFAVVDSHHLLHLVYLFGEYLVLLRTQHSWQSNTPELVAASLAAAKCVSPPLGGVSKTPSVNLADSHGQ